MTDPIRILHFADVHIGVESYGTTDPATGLSSRVQDFFDRLTAIYDHAAAQEADLILFAGDAFKTRSPGPTHQREFARFVRDLAALCPVVLLVGSHDLPAGAGKAASLEIYDVLDVPNVTVGTDYAVQRVETRRGPVQVATAPYPLRGRLLEPRKIRGLSIEAIDDLLRDGIVTHLHALAEAADADPAPRILLGHFSVSGALPGSERGMLLGRDAPLPLDVVADPRWDYVALGHLHRHQVLTPEDVHPPVIYSGSVERMDFSEAGEGKGFVRAEVTRGHTSWQFIPLDARPFLTIEVDTRGASDPTQIALEAVYAQRVQDAVVRVIVQADEGSAHLLRDGDIRRAVLNAGADHVAALQKHIDRPLHARLGSSPEQLDPEALLRRHFEQQDIPPDRLEELLIVARDIMSRR